jgi:hypothetical protein
MIHGHKLRIKSLKGDLAEIEIELYEVIGQLKRGKSRLGFEEWNRVNRLREQLLKEKKKLLNLVSRHKRQIRLIKSKKLKKKK